MTAELFRAADFADDGAGPLYLRLTRTIGAAIEAGALRPGESLPPERELAATFRVSRNTLREALRALELAGMIESRKGATGGAFVRSGNPQVVVGGMRDLYHLGAITPEHLTEARIWFSNSSLVP